MQKSTKSWRRCEVSVMSQEGGVVKGAWSAQLKLLQHLSGSLRTDKREYCSGKLQPCGKLSQRIHFNPKSIQQGFDKNKNTHSGKLFHCVCLLPVGLL